MSYSRITRCPNCGKARESALDDAFKTKTREEYDKIMIETPNVSPSLNEVVDFTLTTAKNKALKMAYSAKCDRCGYAAAYSGDVDVTTNQ